MPSSDDLDACKRRVNELAKKFLDDAPVVPSGDPWWVIAEELVGEVVVLLGLMGEPGEPTCGCEVASTGDYRLYTVHQPDPDIAEPPTWHTRAGVDVVIRDGPGDVGELPIWVGDALRLGPLAAHQLGGVLLSAQNVVMGRRSEGTAVGGKADVLVAE